MNEWEEIHLGQLKNKKNLLIKHIIEALKEWNIVNNEKLQEQYF